MTGHVAQFFLEDSEWNQALQDIYQALKAGGHLVFESRNPDVTTPFANWPTSTHHDKIADTPLGPVEWWSDKLVIADSYASYTLHYLFIETGEEILSDNKLKFRAYDELQKSLEDAGFTVEQAYGSWNGEPFEPRSPEMVFVAKAVI